MPIFTRRHYQWLAEFCASIDGQELRKYGFSATNIVDQDELAEMFCESLKKENESFEPESFMKTYHTAELKP